MAKTKTKVSDVGCAATLRINNPSHFSKKGAADIAKWLRQQATFIKKNYLECDGKFTARYLYKKH